MLEQSLAFAFFAFAASVTPGPNNVVLTATGAQVGMLRGFPTLLGITVGFAVMVFLLTYGVGSAFLEQPAFMQILRVVGIVMLVWLSWQIAFAPVEGEVPGQVSLLRPLGFVGGMLFQWVNPKAWLVVATAISAYMVPGYTAFAQASTFATVFFVAGVLGCLPWLAFGAVMNRVLKTPRAARFFNYAMGALLLATLLLIVR